ncbi:tautomerase [Sinomonas atrocyanea]|uniref:Tautomerase n=2 Tax=Sinomonas atrocyanea TaxID=37927 RepID=A0A126ZZ04_9MICC|nr:tautomerase [Sinomonas atrocyanea]
MLGQTITERDPFMPLVRIDVAAGRTPEQLARISRAIHEAILAEYRIPERDYFHIVTEHAPGQIVAQDAGLGFERSSGVVMVQIFTQGGRSQEAKGALFAAVARNLGDAGVAGEDVFIGYVENTAGDWSFGFGRAQYVTGELAVPAR